MNQAEERRGERQTFELGAEEVRNRKGYACTVYRKPEKKNEGGTEIEPGGKVEEVLCRKKWKALLAEEWRCLIFDSYLIPYFKLCHWKCFKSKTHNCWTLTWVCSSLPLPGRPPHGWCVVPPQGWAETDPNPGGPERDVRPAPVLLDFR